MTVINKVDYVNIGYRTTACTLITEEGIEITGLYVCKERELRNLEVRREKAYQNALKNLSYYKAKIEREKNKYSYIN